MVPLGLREPLAGKWTMSSPRFAQPPFSARFGNALKPSGNIKRNGMETASASDAWTRKLCRPLRSARTNRSRNKLPANYANSLSMGEKYADTTTVSRQGFLVAFRRLGPTPEHLLNSEREIGKWRSTRHRSLLLVGRNYIISRFDTIDWRLPDDHVLYR